MVCHVADPRRAAWKVGVEDPRHAHRLVATVPLRSGAVATSSASHRGHHIPDGRSGRVATGIASVTVVADELT